MSSSDTTLGGSHLDHSAPEELSNMAIVWTILAHPDPARVGERAPVPNLEADLEARAELSRTQPIFSSLDSPDFRALEDQHLSRKGIVLKRGADAVELERAGFGGEIEVDGEPMAGSVRLPLARLEEGVVILLAGRVALLLHRGPTVLRNLGRSALIGQSQQLLRSRKEIKNAAQSGLPVLILGETGTGKELAAREIHRLSARSKRPFVPVNMASLPVALAAAELFGSTKGAFTNAVARPGLFREADGGSLFLDEIGAVEGGVQALLLRALEESRFRPLGVDREVSVDVRVVAATDEDLEARIEDGHFRRPLYERLRGFVVHLPPLRQRREDIGRLLMHFLREELESMGQSQRLRACGGSEEPWLRARTVARLARAEFPGNVRQLKLLCARMASSFASERRVSHSTVEGWLASSPMETAPRERARAVADTVQETASPAYRDPDEVSDAELVEGLRANSWQVLKTAKALGISRTSLYALMEKSTAVRKGSDLSEDEVRTVLRDHEGLVAAAASALQVSKRALQLRMSELGIESREFR